MMETRYFIDRDETGDYYYIPVNLEKKWRKWVDSDGASELPNECFYIGGYANRITFTNPKLK